jgi:predicted acetyltransferase
MEMGEGVRVPTSSYWLKGGGGILGAAVLRRGLDSALEVSGGHIGMRMPSGARSLSLETKLLSLMVSEAGFRGMKHILVTCSSDDAYGVKAARRNGGSHLDDLKVLNSRGLVERRFLIDTKRPYENWRAPGFCFRQEGIWGDELHLRLFDLEPEEMKQCPTYRFDIVRNSDGAEIGCIDLRVGFDEEIYYSGNIGYRIYEDYRGRGCAAKAASLLFGLAKEHGMEKLMLTCNPDNVASAKTCERIGAKYVEFVRVPKTSEQHQQGDRFKKRFELDLKRI